MEFPSLEVDLARSAFVAAHGRFSHDHVNRAANNWYASLGETLWWIFALDEHYRHRNQHIYESYRDGDTDGQVVAGLRLARNRVGHQLAMMLEDPRDHFTLAQRSLASPADLAQLVWRRLEDLPPGDPKKESESQAKAYKKHLVGNAARYALRRSNYFFVRRRAELEAVFSR